MHIVNVRFAEIIEIAEDIGVIDTVEALDGKDLRYEAINVNGVSTGTIFEPNMAGTTGQNLALSLLAINANGLVGNENIRYRFHSNGVWQPWVNRGNNIGVAGQPLTAIQIELVNMTGWGIYTRVHVSNIGWMEWKRNGETAGVVGNPGSFRIEAIEIYMHIEPPLPTGANESAFLYFNQWNGNAGGNATFNDTVDLHLLAGERVRFRTNTLITGTNPNYTYGIVEKGKSTFATSVTSTSNNPDVSVFAPSNGTYTVRVVNNNTSSNWSMNLLYSVITAPTQLTFYLDPTFRADMRELHPNTRNNITYPFTQTFGIRYDYRTENFNTILCAPNRPFIDGACGCHDNLCPRLSGGSCNCVHGSEDSTGTNCDKAHHTNFNQNRLQARAHRELVGKRELGAMLVSFYPCAGAHSGAYGWACSEWSITNFSTERPPVHRIRIAQHEIGHNYGAGHCSALSNPCVMNNSAYQTAAMPLTITNVFCNICTQTVKTNRIKVFTNR